ncbi:response regulator transcription factor [Mucilaginibacter aquaedulcis]|uniref:response regulator transcription factor n=1 Tax=Mucilaginibacter aquaedulcis TaxID=1187081 RepID=UPI0025B2DF05|nr:response regulator transcription factor [Mucilaginibacter aquaedulcis]MDN3548943.1 response regulator transcription factor [Mucilaginibacter aquaedulcis]
MKIKVGIVDDHQLFLRSLSLMLNSSRNYKVVIEATNGQHLKDKIYAIPELPDIMLIDVSMPVMDGQSTAAWMNRDFPSIKLVALSMNDKDIFVINMIKAGCCAYLLKDISPKDFETALDDVSTKGFHNSDVCNARRLMKYEEGVVKLTENEKKFLQYACTDMTYKEIANLMFLSERTIDGYRASIFQKLNVETRVGMAMEAVRRELVRI